LQDDAITYRGTVYPWQCDHMGHMNVMWYVGKFDEALWTLFQTIGITPSYLRGQGRGMAALQQTIHYQRELLAGDVVAIESMVTDVSEKLIVVKQVLYNAEHGHVSASVELTGVHMDRTMRRETPFPEHIARAARAKLAPRPLDLVID
jgi:acyl-CoA thioester hydrolase